jgi:hypothetical protein
MGAFPLLGLDRHAWNTQNESDLVALMPREGPDHFSRWFTDKFMPMFHYVFGEKFKV